MGKTCIESTTVGVAEIISRKDEEDHIIEVPQMLERLALDKVRGSYPTIGNAVSVNYMSSLLGVHQVV